MLTQAASALAGAGSAVLPWVLGSLAQDMRHSREASQVAQAPVPAEQAAGSARQFDDPSTRARCLLALHGTIWLPASAGDRLKVTEEVIGLARRVSDHELHTGAPL